MVLLVRWILIDGIVDIDSGIVWWIDRWYC